MGHVLCWFSEILVPLWTGSGVIFCIRLDDAGLMLFGRLGPILQIANHLRHRGL